MCDFCLLEDTDKVVHCACTGESSVVIKTECDSNDVTEQADEMLADDTG